MWKIGKEEERWKGGGRKGEREAVCKGVMYTTGAAAGL